MEYMKTVSQVINDLREQGYTEDLNLKRDSLESANGQFQLFHKEFVIDKVFRFEGQSDPADEATVYAISSSKHGIKGVLVNGAGIYTDDITDEMLDTLQMRRK
jgi:hypothetical protein